MKVLGVNLSTKEVYYQDGSFFLFLNYGVQPFYMKREADLSAPLEDV